MAIKMLNTLYIIWGVVWVTIGFIVTMPLNLLFLSFRKTYPIAHFIRKVWAYIIFVPTGISVKVKGKKYLHGVQKAIYVPNHSSYIDIPTCTIALPGVLSFMAKEELAKVPLFGYYFRTIDVAVKRKDIRNAYKSFLEIGERINANQRPLIFPEGTIPNKAPNLGTFKLGAFKLAIEKGVPIVPVTMPNNAQCFPDQKPLVLRRKTLNVTIHRPIPTANLKPEDASTLMKKVFNIIESELIHQKAIKS
jgi:1-acyl-sn-glycerol-3-phosphate acyltransferase